MSEVAGVASWVVQQEVPIPEGAASLLLPTEQLVAVYTTPHDSVIFATKRLILRDVRGVRGKKMGVQSLSYSVITTWSSVHNGSVNKLELWTTAGKIGIARASKWTFSSSRHADCYVRAGRAD